MDNMHFEKQYKEKGFTSQRRYPNEALIQFLAGNYFYLPINKRGGIRVLELGCGSGANLWMVAREGFSAYGIDIAPTGISLCKQMLNLWGVKADVRLGDMKKLDFKNAFFDIIFDVVSMQHITTQEHTSAYKEAHRCLKKGGYFFQWHLGKRSTPFMHGGGKRIDRLTIDNISNPDMPLYNSGPTCFLTPADAKIMLRSAGFKKISIETVTRSYKEMAQIIEYLSITAKK